MRVGDATFYLRYLAGLQLNGVKSEQALRGLADGKKLRVASDDPTGAQESLSLRKRLTRLVGFDRSADSARASLSTLDTALGGVFDLLSETQLLGSAGSSFPSDGQNDIRADRVDSIREAVLALANSTLGDRFLFGGTETTAPPFAADGTYSGNNDEQQAPIDSQQQVGATLSGERAFVNGVDIFTLLSDVSDALRNNQTADVGALLPALGDALDQIGQIHAEVGSRGRQIDQQILRHGDEEVALIARITEIEDIDFAQAVVDLQAADTAGSALSAAAARVLGRSLFDFLG